MTPERWQQIESLYHAVRERGRGVLEGTEPDLRGEVEKLLAEDSGGKFLDGAAADLLKQTMTAEVPIGTQLGPYRIDAPIGAGGMGQVFRATDTRLGRSVAIKTSKAQFSERFEREARAIAALNHPNICQLYDVGPNYLVMEHVEGEAPKGPLPAAQVERIALQIADALDAAHEKGITHRDLKPANIKITTDGTVKVLDFGLAKVMGMTVGETESGMMMGTVGYMAPEQARGQKVDKRADIWAFGVVIWELLAGERLFQGQSSADVLGKVLEQEIDVSCVPEKFRRLLTRCLDRDVKTRLRDIGEVGFLLNEPAPVAAAGRLPWAWSLAAAFLVLAVLGVLLLLWRQTPRPLLSNLTVSISPPPNTAFRVAANYDGGFAVSPDGTMLAFVGRTNNKPQLWIRRFDSPQARLFSGTDGAYFPFWSPDSKSVAFFTATPAKLNRVDITSGAVIAITDTAAGMAGGSWNATDVILVSSVGRGISRVPAVGGASTPIEGAMGVFPHFLPDGRHFVFTARLGSMPLGPLMLGSLDPTEKPRRLAENALWPQYSAGHLVFFRAGRIFAQGFDPSRAVLSGEPFPIAEVAHRVFMGSMLTTFSVNPGGSIVYPPPAHVFSRLVWRDRTGKLLGELDGPGEHASPRISPDAKRVAFGRRENNNTDVWIAGVNGEQPTRFTFEGAVEQHPVWSPDGKDLIFTSGAGGPLNIYRKPVTGATAAQRMTASAYELLAYDWSSDGRFLLFAQLRASLEIMVLPISGGEALSFLGHARGAANGQFSPGVPRWISYDFDDSGRRELYVQAFQPGQQATAARWQISTQGGRMARWRGDGKEMFYLTLDGNMIAVAVDGSGEAFKFGAPAHLFDTAAPQMRSADFDYDVTRDGQRFLLMEPAEKAELLPLTLLTNWPAAIRKP